MGQGTPQQLDLTQEELALCVGCSLVLISKDRGRRAPSFQAGRRPAGSTWLSRSANAPISSAMPGRARDVSPALTTGAPWRSLHSRFTNLPVQPAPFFGRARPLPPSASACSRNGSVLLTLVGPPGIGKTRLGIETAATLLDDFEDGVFFVSLASARDPDQVGALPCPGPGAERERWDAPLRAGQAGSV